MDKRRGVLAYRFARVFSKSQNDIKKNTHQLYSFTEVNIMSNSNQSSSRMEVPEAREAMDRFKMEVASEIGVPLKQGYNGNLTSAQNGSVGGEMVRQMIKKQEESMSGK